MAEPMRVLVAEDEAIIRMDVVATLSPAEGTTLLAFVLFI